MCVSRRENASDLVQSLWMSRSGMWCTATSCRRSERSLRQCSSKDHSNHLLLSSKCTQMSPETPCDTQRPRLVALTSRSRLRERPRWVAARGRSEAISCLREKWRETSPCRSGKVAPSFGSDFSTSLWKVAPRSEFALDESLRDVVQSDLMPSLREVAPGSARPKTTLVTSFELQMHPNVSRNSCGTQIPDRDIYHFPKVFGGFLRTKDHLPPGGLQSNKT
ncbi:hypothetical protein IGI04_004086 [Brassica rapa subsp. trilocularis]|uniref:Uncharacterized protein n=1 Tax=Brassica rapa subsp. trilocularis TaxID=1813537 RepID=A0ABQ7P3Q6_BRACM|nr:hypothetical protein IGI04_004086 [Brassica rapa subsp. trilocularis]